MGYEILRAQEKTKRVENLNFNFFKRQFRGLAIELWLWLLDERHF